MTLTVLRAADRAAVPWKNGGGVTREVAAWPPGSGFDDFAWRVSMAEVREDGPFSSFPGVDRVLAVLEGAMRLTVEGGGVVDLAPDAPPAVFDGEARAGSKLTAGPVLDLNVMTRRGVARARVDLVSARVELPAGPGHRLVVALGDITVLDGTARHALGRYDAVLITEPLTIQASAQARAYAITLTTRAPTDPRPPAGSPL
ncbi:MAG: HutD family protein [Alphaproteobacteria bacterium]|nr:HutD family protein [Alphaproteobacteria bacterium]MBU1516751.1 HutD family protein [Alphaproteobacteria bacterium]MBU2092445.1 HutD family protein [Alphaproteobacteria bacterium]MBU2152701.1 HutD family protein [Alphaproteobacteria bacterium]MBU2305635.1 HutD family protein [Alphaproteobacteria bacterium]